MRGRVLLPIGAALLAALGGAGWAAASSSTPTAPVIGPAVVVVLSATPTENPTGAAKPSVVGTAVSSSPQTVDPRWVRTVDDDDLDDEGSAKQQHDD
jgi:hypothetical protein